MPAVITGPGLGLERSSANLLGAAGQLGQPAIGQAGNYVYANAASGNLIVQATDQILIGVGLNDVLARTYNSQGTISGSNGALWSDAASRHVNLASLTGTLNTSGSTIQRVAADGAVVTYTYATTGPYAGSYVGNENGGAWDTLTYAAGGGSPTWTWVDGASATKDIYDANNSGRIMSSLDDTGKNTLTYSYTSGLLTSINSDGITSGGTTTAGSEYVTLNYNASNQIASITTTLNGGSSFTQDYYSYDSSGRLISEATNLGSGAPTYTSVSGDTLQSIATSLWGNANLWSGIAAANGLTISGTTVLTTGTVLALPYVTAYGYSGSTTYLTSVAQTDGSSLTITYNGSNQVSTLAQSLASGMSASLTLAGYAGGSTTATDSNSNVTTFSYSTSGALAGELTTITPALGSGLAASFTYDSMNDVLTATAPNGDVNTYTYDSSYGTKLSSVDSLGDTVSYTYTTLAGYGSNAPDLLLTATQYLAATPGNTATTQPLTTQNFYSTDGQNNLLYAVSPNGEITQYLYADSTKPGVATSIIHYPSGISSPPLAGGVAASVVQNTSGNPIALGLLGGAPTSLTLTGAAGHGTATVSGTTITYTPTAGYTGADSFSYTATNAVGTSGTATVNVTVTAQPVVANAAIATVAYASSGNTISLNLTGAAATSVSVSTAAAHGTATASGTSITYTPNSTYAGTDSFQYTATNAAGVSAPATVTITVNPQSAPTASSSSATVAYGSSNNAISLTLAGGPASDIVITSATSHGIVVANGTSVTYTPAAGYGGADSFQYKAVNADGASSTATVTLTVSPLAPTAGAVSTTVAYGSSTNPITLALGGGTATSVTVSTAAGHGTATASGASITYTPTGGYTGLDSFQYTATNATGTSSAGTVSILVSGAAPVAGTATDTVAVNSSNDVLYLNLSGGVATGASIFSAASHGTVSASGTTISYTPTAGYTGSDSFQYKASNAAGISAAATITVSVTAAVTTTAFLSSGSGNWTVPTAWNPSNNTIQVLGAGGGGASSSGSAEASGGGGGAFSSITNSAILPGASVYYSIGAGGAGGTSGGVGSAGGDTWFGATTEASAPVAAKGGAAGGEGTSAAGGAAASGAGTVKYSGGASGTSGNGSTTVGTTGGGGAAGPNGAGGASGASAANNSGTGGGGADGGAASAAATSSGAATAGGSNINGIDGGAASTSYTAAGVAGTAQANTGGAGGGGGYYDPTVGCYGASSAGGAGAIGEEWTSAYGSGGGGGGGGYSTVLSSSNNGVGGAGGTYGGGGGGGGGSLAGGAGGGGLIAITYTTLAGGNGPQAANETVSTAQGTALTFNPLTADSDPLGYAMSVVGVTGSSHAQVTFTSSSITYTPLAGYSGPDSITYTISDGHGAYATGSISVTDLPNAPVAGVVTATVAYGASAAPITLNLSGGTAASVTVAAPPAHGTVAVSGANLTYTPATGYTGTDSFWYTVTNVTGTSAAALATITVSAQIPTATSSSAVVATNSANDPIALTLGGGAANNVTVTSAASHGVAITSGTAISYTPTAGYSGTDTFSYAASSAGGVSSVATVTVTVAALPVANGFAVTVPYGAVSNPITLALSGSTATSVAVTGAAGHGTATASGTSITYTPAAGYSGPDSFSYTATNANGTSSAATVTVTVADPVAPALTLAALNTWAGAVPSLATTIRTDNTAINARGQVTTAQTYSVAPTTTTVSGGTVAASTSLSWDSAGRLLQSQTSGFNASQVSSFDGLGRVTSTTNADGQTTTYAYTYGAGGPTITATTAESGTTIRTVTSTYNLADELLTRTDSISGIAATYSYDGLGELRSVTDPTGVATYSVYDKDGRKVASVMADGSITAFTYNALGQVIETIQYANKLNSTQLTSLSSGSYPTPVTLSSIMPTTSSADRTTFSIYDLAGRVAQTIDGLGAITTYQYNGASQLVSSTTYATMLSAATVAGYETAPPTSAVAPTASPGADKVTTYVYDNDGKVTATVKSAGGLNLATVKTYDAFGNVIAVTDPTGGTSRFVYDSAGRLTFSIDAVGDVTQTTYNAESEVTQTQTFATVFTTSGAQSLSAMQAWASTNGSTANDRITRYVYNASGQQAFVIDPLGDVRQSFYDAVGNVVATQAFATLFTTTGAQTLLAMTSWAASNATANDRITRFAYNGDGQQVYAIDAAGGVTKTVYDADGHVFATTAYATPFTTTLTPASLAALTAASAATSGSEAYAIAAGVTVAAGSDQTTTYVRDVDGRLTYKIDPTGQLTEYDYDTSNNLVQTIIYAGTATAPTSPNTASSPLSAWTTVNNQIIGGSGLATLTGNRITRAVYNADDELAYSIDPDGKVTAYAYDAFGDIVQTDRFATLYATTGIPSLATMVSWAAGNATASDRISRAVFDSNNRQVYAIDPAGDVSQIIYDAAGRVVSTRIYSTPLTATQLSALSAAATPAMVAASLTVSANDRTKRLAYDADGRLAFSIDAAGDVTQNSYDAFSNLVTTRRFATLYATAGVPSLSTMASWATTNASATLDEITTFVYDADGRLRYSIDANGRPTEVDYDAFGHVVQSIQYKVVSGSGLTAPSSPIGALASVQSAIASAITAATLTAPRVSRSVYNPAGELAFSIDADGDVTGYTYDAFGNVVQTGQFATVYSTTGVPSQATMTTWVASNTTASDRVSRLAYDADNRLAFAIDPAGDVVQKIYDLFGGVVATRAYATVYSTTGIPSLATMTSWASSNTTSSDHISRSVYDADGQLLYAIDPVGDVARFTYDAFGAVVASYSYATQLSSGVMSGLAMAVTAATIAADVTVSTGADQITRVVYDAAGRQIYRIDAIGDVVQTSYDGFSGVATSLAYATPIASGTFSSLPLAASASAIAAAVSATVSDQPVRYAYDAAGRILTKTDALGYVTTNQYDAFGNQVKVTDPRGNAGYFYYDRLNRLTMQVDADGYATQTAYSIGDQVTNVTRYQAPVTSAPSVGAPPSVSGSTEVTAIGRDNLDRITSNTDANSNVTAYVMNAFGQQTQVTNALSGKTLNTYDLAGRLTFTVDPAGDVKGYSYDAFGNQTQVHAYTTALTSSQLTTLYGYANVTTANVAAVVTAITADATTNFAYDALSRLTQQTETVYLTSSSNTTATQTRVYDAFGNALETIDADSNKTYFYFDQLNRKTASVSPVGTLSAWTYNAFNDAITARVYGDLVTLPSTPGGTPPAPVHSNNYRETDTSFDADNRTVQTALTGQLNGTAGILTGSEVGGTFTTVTATSIVSGTMAYDADGNLVRQSDGDGNAIYFFYDAAGRKIAQVDPSNYLTTYKLDNEGNTLAEQQYALPTTVSGGITVATTLDTVMSNTANSVAYGSSNNIINLNLTGGPAKSVTISTAAAHGTASVSGTTALYTPTSTYSGADSFQYTVTFANGSTYVGTANVTVSPQATSAYGYTSSSTNLITTSSTNNVINLVMTGDPVSSVTITSGASHGAVSVGGVSAGHAVTYTPTAGYSGADSFSYSVAYSDGATATTGTISLTVGAGPSPTVTTPAPDRITTFTYDLDGQRLTETRAGVAAATVSGSGAPSTSIANSTITFTYNGLGEVTSQTQATGDYTNYIYDAAGRQTQVLTTAFTAFDGSTVQPSTTYVYNGLSNLVSTTVGDNVGASVSVSSTGNSLPINLTGGTATAVTIISGPYEGTATTSGTTLSYTPTASFTGYDSITYQVSFSSGGPVTRTIMVAVGSPQEVTSDTYGAGGRIATTTDAMGNVTTYSYDANANAVGRNYNRLTASSSIAEEMESTFDATGRLVSNYTADWNGSAYVSGDVNQTQYDAYGEVIAKGVNSGYQQTYGYDLAGHQTSATAANGSAQLFVTDANGNQTLEIDSEGANLFVSGTSGALLSVASVLAADTTSGIINSGLTSTLISTITAYDARGEKIQIIDPQRQLTAASTATMTDAKTYDAFGDVTRDVTASGDAVLYSYNTLGAVTQQQNMGYLIGSAYQGVSITANNGTVSSAAPTLTYAYDISGRVIGTDDANNYWTTRQLGVGTGYNGANAVATATFYPDASETTVGLDVFGNARTLTNQLGVVVTQGFNGLNQLTSVTQPVLAASGGTYTVTSGQTLNSISTALWGTTALATLLAQANALSGYGVTTVLTTGLVLVKPAIHVVTSAETLQSIAYSLWGSTSLAYLLADANFLGVNATLTAGQTLLIPTNPGTAVSFLTTNYVDDQFGQKIKEWNSQFGSGVIETTTYDGQGRITAQIDFMGYTTSTAYSYSGTLATGGMSTFGGWTKTTTNATGLTATDNTDFFGREVSKTDFGGDTYAYTYDLAGRLIHQTNAINTSLNTLTNSAAQNLYFAYFNTGKQASEVDGSAVGASSHAVYYTQDGYDIAGNLTSETYTKYTDSAWVGTAPTGFGSATASASFENATSTYDALNRRVTFADTGMPALSGWTYTNLVTLAYQYDAANNLRNLLTYNSLVGGQYNYWYTYDSLDRFLITQGSLVGSTIGLSTTGVGDQLTYDAAGDRTSDTTTTESVTAIVVSGDPTYYVDWTDTHIEAYSYTPDGNLATVSIKDDTIDKTSGTVTTGTPIIQAINVRDQLGRVTGYTEYGTNATTINYSQGTVYNYDSQTTVQATQTTSGSAMYSTIAQFYYNAYVSGSYTGAYQGGAVTGIQTKTGGAGSRFTGQAVANILNVYGYLAPQGNPSCLIGSGGITGNSTTTNSYTWWNTAQLSHIVYTTGSTLTSSFTFDASGNDLAVSKSNSYSELDSYTSNAAGEITSREVTSSQSNNPVQFYFYMGGTQLATDGTNGPSTTNYMQAMAYRTANPAAGTFSTATGLQIDAASYGNAYQPINPTSQSTVNSSYTVGNSDTLQSVAQTLWGDSSLWYVIADANGLSGGNTILTPGSTLVIPSRVTDVHNTSATFTVYDPNKALGDVQPGQPKPPKHGCGAIGAIIVAVIAIAVLAIPGVGEAIDSAVSSILDPLLMAAGPAVTSGIADAVVGIADAAVGGALGDAVGQGVAMAVGAQSKFNWGEVAMAGIGAAVGAGLNLPGSPLYGKGPGLQIARAMAGSAITQGIGVATGLQHSFSWLNVGLAGVEAGVTAAVSGPVGGFFGAKQIGPGAFENTPGGFAATLTTSAASLIVGAATESMLSNRSFGQSLQDQLPNVVGQTVGNLIASGMQPAPSPSDSNPSPSGPPTGVSGAGAPVADQNVTYTGMLNSLNSGNGYWNDGVQTQFYDGPPPPQGSGEVSGLAPQPGVEADGTVVVTADRKPDWAPEVMTTAGGAKPDPLMPNVDYYDKLFDFTPDTQAQLQPFYAERDNFHAGYLTESSSPQGLLFAGGALGAPVVVLAVTVGPVVGAFLADSSLAAAAANPGTVAAGTFVTKLAYGAVSGEGQYDVPPAAGIADAAPSVAFDLSKLSGAATLLDRPWLSTMARNDGLLGEKAAAQLLNDATGLKFRPIQNASGNGIDLIAVDVKNMTVWAPEVKSSTIGKFGDPGNLLMRTQNWLTGAASNNLAGQTLSSADVQFAKQIQTLRAQGYTLRPLVVNVSIPAVGTAGHVTAIVVPR